MRFQVVGVFRSSTRNTNHIPIYRTSTRYLMMVWTKLGFLRGVEKQRMYYVLYVCMVYAPYFSKRVKEKRVQTIKKHEKNHGRFDPTRFPRVISKA
jgi:predicted aconitase